MNIDRESIIKEKHLELFYKSFSNKEYSNAILALCNLSENEELDDIEIEFVFNAFVAPNIEEIKFNFEKNVKFLNLNYDFGNMEYYILPTEYEGKYFILDKKNKRIVKIKEDFRKIYIDEQKFSDYSIIIEKNKDIINPFIVASDLKLRNRNLYVVINKEIEAFLQIKEYDKDELNNIKIFKSLLDFEKYFIESEDYFPRNTVKYDNNPINRLEEIRERIHFYRINKKCTKRPLLSIGIPSAERGTFALSSIINTLKSKFDYEIEIIISDNASTTLPQYYNIIKSIQDSRLVYNRNDINLGYHGNVKKLIELAKAKYILFNCDTDVLITDRLEEILSIIRDAKQNYSQIITDGYTKGLGKNDLYIKSAYDTLNNVSFMSNYLFGNIFNVDLIKENRFIEYLDFNADHSEFILSYYHMAIDLFLESFGNTFVYSKKIVDEYAGETSYLVSKKLVYLKIDEFEDFEDFTYKYNSEFRIDDRDDRTLITGYVVGYKVLNNILRVYTIAGRTAQHISCSKLLKDILYDKDLISEFIVSYTKLYTKTLFLIGLNAGYNYKETDLKNEEIINKIEKSMDYINKENDKFYQLLQDYEKKSGISVEMGKIKNNIENEYEMFIKNMNSKFFH
ncbi:hypothetical protein HMPREF9628_01099 [Peptoanaerobacter stomatis]|uniref:Glycosyltransferase 2-like domain-containing protein n=1 Tax=Peptoanaerobacter stomatis TaxID=796937 RepID=G9XAT2_9FIRM|nr:glycosyltransferase [Peptoanaerobacter stomatis]EHL19926.1 hypothetical protein HMPREF9628_01099 [Peptoanaerobacter stomatis]